MSFPLRSIVLSFFTLAGGAAGAQAPSQFLMPDRAAEVALARTAAPKSISDSAAVMVLTSRGYVQVAPGTNGFVCIVLRAFSGALSNVNSWTNPRIRAPLCINPPAVRSMLPEFMNRAALVMSGVPAVDIQARTYKALANHELPSPENGAMAYMMSPKQYLADENPHFKSHVMFFYGGARPGGSEWGAGDVDAPIIDGGIDPKSGLSIILIPVSHWSDGTPANH